MRIRTMKGKFLALALAIGLSVINVFPAMAAQSAMDILCAPSGITAGPDGTFLVTDTFHKVVWSVKDRTSTIYAGTIGVTDLYGEPVGGYRDSRLDNSFFKEPWDIVPFLDGYAVSDAENHVVRLIRSDKTQTACGSGVSGFRDGKGVQASFSRPTGLAADGQGTLYIADTNNNAIRTINSKGEVGTYIKNIQEPTGLCYAGGVLYVAESGANRIIKIVDGAVIAVAGSGAEGNADGAAAQAQFSNPQGILVSDDGILYVADTGNGAVRKVRNGAVTTLIASDPAALEPFPVAPRGMMIRGDQLYVCDNFSKKLLSVPR